MITRLTLPLVIVGLVVLAIVVSTAGDETRVELDYLERVHSQATNLARSGDALRDVTSRLQRIERTEFMTVVDGIQEDLNVGLALIAEEPPAPSLIPVRALYRETLETWDRGIADFAQSILEAADDPESTVAVDLVAESLAEIRAGDNAYASLVFAMGREDIPGTLSPMPTVVMTPAEGRLVSLSESYVDSARSENSGLGLRPGLGISQIVTDPEWQVNPEGQAVVPATNTIIFSIVVTNAGNIVSEEVGLVVELIGGVEPTRVTDVIAPLDPNQQVTMVLEPIDVESGGIYEVKATLAVTGNDANFEDNEKSVEFSVNDE